MNRNADLTPTSFLSMREDVHQENVHSSDKRSGILLMKSKPQGEWDRVAELIMIKFSESGHPVFRATSPFSRGTLKAKVVENYQYTSALMRERLKLFFAQLFLLISSVFTEQSQICVRKYEACHVRTERLVLAGQSDPLFGQQVC